MKYQPPCTITTEILNLVAAISEATGRVDAFADRERPLRLRRINRVLTVRGSLAIEGNTLGEAMITAILEGKRVAGPPVAPHVTPQVGELLATLDGEMSREELQVALKLSDRKSFRERYLKPALAGGLIEMTVPDRPSSRLQKYRLTGFGRRWLERR